MGQKKKKREYSSDSDGSSDSEPIEKSKKHKKSSKKSKKHKSKKKRQQSSSSNESDAWVEKNVDKEQSPPNKPAEDKTQREDWMSADNFFLPTFTKEKQPTKSATEKANLQVYDPATSSRELNPYYKTGEGGMPSFQRPKDDDDCFDRRQSSYRQNQSSSSTNWRKSRPEETYQETRAQRRRSPSRSRSQSVSRSRSGSLSSPEVVKRVMLPAKPEPAEISASHSDFLTDEQMNTIGAKMIKAELMGNTEVAEKLKGKLDRAKAFKGSGKAPPKRQEKEEVVLSITNAAGTTRPATQREDTSRRPQDRKKNKRVDTHEGGERTKYYPDDGKYDIKQMVSLLEIFSSSWLLIAFILCKFCVSV